MSDSQNRYTAGEIAQLKASIDLVEMIRRKVDLKRAGAEWTGLCPFHSEKTPSFFVVPKKQIFHCFAGCGTGDVFEWLKRTEGLTFAAAVQHLRGTPSPTPSRFVSASTAGKALHDDAVELRKKIAKARQIWKESIPAQGTIVDRYLASRGLDGFIVPPTLRFHPQLWNAETSTLMPGMVAAVTDARQQIVGIHRTFLRADGAGKAHVKSPKKMLGACMGGHVCLALPSGGKLAISEGIETGLSVMMARPDLAVWAALSLGNMGAPVPASITELILCADGDNKDQKAADGVLDSAVARHRKGFPQRAVVIARPTPGMDFNDMLLASRQSLKRRSDPGALYEI